MVALDVDLELALQTVALEEAVHRRRVVVVLMLGGLLRLGLDQQRPGEADLVLVRHHQLEEPRELVALLTQAGVQQRLVALAPAPQDVVLTAEAVRGLHRVAHLRCGMGKHLRVGVGGTAGGVAGMGEQVGRAPEQAHTGLGLLLGGPLDEDIQVGFRLAQRLAGRRHVHVVEAIERRAQLGEELERGVLLGERSLHRVDAGGQPRAVERAGAEDVAPGPVEAVPVAHGDAQMLGHRLAGDHPVRVVHAVRQFPGIA